MHSKTASLSNMELSKNALSHSTCQREVYGMDAFISSLAGFGCFFPVAVCCCLPHAGAWCCSL